jgi:hypothetical protein
MSADTSAVDERQRKRMPIGRRFKPGVSACPGGKHGMIRRLRAEQVAKLTAHHGRALLPQEVELVEQLVAVKLAKPQSTSDTIKQANTVARLMHALYGHHKPEAEAAIPSVAELLEADE